MTRVQVVEMSVTVNNDPIWDYVHLDDHTQPTYEMTAEFKPLAFTVLLFVLKKFHSFVHVEIVNQYYYYFTPPSQWGKKKRPKQTKQKFTHISHFYRINQR